MLENESIQISICSCKNKPLGQKKLIICFSCTFLAHLWGAYAIPVALSGVRCPSYVVCRLCPP